MSHEDWSPGWLLSSAFSKQPHGYRHRSWARFGVKETPFHLLCLEKEITLSSLLAESYLRSGSAWALIEKKSVFCNPRSPEGKWKAFPNGRPRQEMFYLLYFHKKNNKFTPVIIPHTTVQAITQEAPTWEMKSCVSTQRGSFFQDLQYFLSQVLPLQKTDRPPCFLSGQRQSGDVCAGPGCPAR